MKVCILSTNASSAYLHYLVVRNSINLFAFSSDSAAVSMSSTSCVICGRFPLLPPRLILEEVELELKPESGTGDDWYSRRKSKPPASQKGGDKDGMHCWASFADGSVCQAAFFRVSSRNLPLGNGENLQNTATPNYWWEWKWYFVSKCVESRIKWKPSKSRFLFLLHKDSSTWKTNILGCSTFRSRTF